MKIGLLGGSFDPPHVAHIAAARYALETFGLDRVELVPALLPPHKLDRTLTPPCRRYAMTVLATFGELGLFASDRDLVRGGVSYAIATLREARAEWPEARIFFILGSDQYREIPGWREPQAIVSEFELIVIGRPRNGSEDRLPPMPDWALQAHQEGRIHEGAMEPIDLSATAIREKRAAGESIEGLVSPAVAEYIDRYELYLPGRLTR